MDTPEGLWVNIGEKSQTTAIPLKSGRRKNSSPSILGHIFCKGEMTPSDLEEEDTESFVSMESDSILASHIYKRSSSGRQPLQATSVDDENAFNYNVSSPQTHHHGGACFSNAMTSFLPSSGANKGQRLCGPCCGANLKSKYLPSEPSPRESSANPVIEALGITPKSRERINKYSVSNAMTTPGVSIPTPATRRKKYTPNYTCSTVPETISTNPSLKDDESIDETAYLPAEFTDAKENALLYTEADLRARIHEALAIQERELTSRFASGSEDSVARDLEMKLQEQLESRGERWNKDLQERLEAARSHHRKMRAALKARVAELEEQCQNLQKRQIDERTEHQQQTEHLQRVMKSMQDSHDTERSKLLEENAKQTEMISVLDESSQGSSKCTPGFIRELQSQVRSLRAEKQEMVTREAQWKEQISELEEDLSHLESTVAEQKEGRLLDQQKISDLQLQLETLGKDKSLVDDELLLLKEKIGCHDQYTSSSSSSSSDKSLEETSSQEAALKLALEGQTADLEKMKMGIQRCLDCLNAQIEKFDEKEESNYVSSTPYDEADSTNSIVGSLEQTVSKLIHLLAETKRMAQNAEEDARHQSDSVAALELEIRNLSDALQSTQRAMAEAAMKYDNQNPSGHHHEKQGTNNNKHHESKMDDLFVNGNHQASVADKGGDDLWCGVSDDLHYEDAIEEGITSYDLERWGDSGSHEAQAGGQSEQSTIAVSGATSAALAKLLQDVESVAKHIAVNSGVENQFTSGSDDRSFTSDEDSQRVELSNISTNLQVLVQGMCSQIRRLQGQYSTVVRDRDNVSLRVKALETGNADADSLREQLETQRQSLAKKEKESIDATRIIQNLSQQLNERPHSSLVQTDENLEGSDHPAEDVANHQSVQHDYAGQIEALEVKLKESEAKLANLLEVVAKKEQENEQMPPALESHTEDTTGLEKPLEALEQQTCTNQSEKAVEMHDMEKQHAESTKEEQMELDELLVMLQLKEKNSELMNKLRAQDEEVEALKELKEKNSELSNKLREQGEEVEALKELKEKNEELSNTLRGQGEEVKALKERREKLEEELSELTQKCDALEQSLKEKDNAISSLDENVSKITLERSAWTRKLDSIITQIDLSEAKHELQNGQLARQKAEALAVESDGDLLKLERVEQHLLHVWDDFVTKKVVELEKQREVLLAMQQEISSLKEESAEKIQQLRDEISGLERKIADKQKTIVASASEIERLKKALSQSLEDASNAEMRHHQSLESTNAMLEQHKALEAEKASLAQRVTSIQDEIDNLRSETAMRELAFAERVVTADDEIESLRREKTADAERVATLEAELESAKREKAIEGSSFAERVATLEAELESAKRVKEIEGLAFTERVAALEAELESAKREKEIEESSFTERVAALEAELESSAKREKELDDLVLTEREETQAALENARQECARLRAQLEAAGIESTNLRRNVEEQVRQVREDHTKEIDDLLAQLDLVEAELNERCDGKDKVLKEKDAIIAALGTQLAESQTRIGFLEDSLTEQQVTIEQSQQDLSRIKGDAEASKCELEKLRETHAKVLESERVKREKAVEAARDETIQEAEIQFKAANSLYRTLVQEYKNEQSMVQKLESELEIAKQEMEKARKEHASTVASLQSDIAELKATQAKADAATARTVKEHLEDLDRLRETESTLQSQLSQVELTNKSIQKLLAAVVSEKEQLLAENEELRVVCEEAMSLAETTHSS